MLEVPSPSDAFGKSSNCCSSKVMISIFKLKILALLMCKDTLENKANLFMETMIGNIGLNCGRDSVAAGNSKLKQGFKLLVYFSEVLPKKYMAEFAEDISYELNKESGENQKPIARRGAP